MRDTADNPEMTDTAEVANRRARLRQLIKSPAYGTQAKFVFETGENQGEISALLNKKSFGEKKARSLEVKCKLPKGWLDIPIGQDLDFPPAPEETADRKAARLRAIYQTLDPARQERLLDYADDLAMEQQNSEQGSSAAQDRRKPQFVNIG